LDAKGTSLKPILLTLLAIAAVGAMALLYSRHLSARSTEQENADSAAVFVFVKIPESLMPIDRGDKYEDPLDEALKKAGLGEVTGGGSQLGDPNPDGTPRIEWIGIDVDLIDLPKGLPFLKAELSRLGAPKGTTLEFEIDGKRISETL
jgi:hypothetical protein